jgi:hypothetical protein
MHASQKLGRWIKWLNCLEKLPKPAHYSSGVRKHWARLGLQLLPLFRNGIA